MATDPVVQLDRRQRRRQETIEEVLDHALDIMAEQGVAGLSIGEIARRMDIRPPSLYVYFPSKHALYDALFTRGAQSVLEAFTAHAAAEPEVADLEEILLRFGSIFVRWSMDNRAYSQLLFWRPVPGFTPSEEAYGPAIALYERGRERFRLLQERGLIGPDHDVDDVQRDWTIVITGVFSQQMSNAPDDPVDEGRFTVALPGLVAMFAGHYGNPAHARAMTTIRRKTPTRSG